MGPRGIAWDREARQVPELIPTIPASKFFPLAVDRLSPSDLAWIEIDGRLRAEEILIGMRTEHAGSRYSPPYQAAHG